MNPQPTDYKSVALPIELRQLDQFTILKSLFTIIRVYLLGFLNCDLGFVNYIIVFNGDLEGTRTLDLQRDRLAF